MNRRGCWITAGTLLGVLALGILTMTISIWRADRDLQEKQDAEIAQIRSGALRNIAIYDDRLMERLANDPQCVASIEEIILYNCHLSKPCWARLSEFSHLKAISMEYCLDADIFFDKTQGLPLIETLRLECGGGDAESRFIARCPNLNHLYLKWHGGSPLAFKGHPRIEVLQLDISKFDEDWLTVLKSLPRLRTLDIEGGDDETSSDAYIKSCKALVKRLQKELPDCKVSGLK